MKVFKLKYILILNMVFFGCKDEFLLDTKNFDPILVVDGMITNEPGPYSIKISESVPVSSTYVKDPFEGCIVNLFDNNGNSETLSEIEPGTYVTKQDGIQGTIGNYYSISIITPDNNEYKTEPQEMKQSTEIDSVYAEFEKREDLNYVYGLPGYQFYVDSKISITQENYFLWKMIETYQYTANGIINEVYNMERTVEDFEKLYECWKTDNVKYIFTGKTSNLSIPKIKKQPLHFVATDTKRLQIRYSLLLKQYAINKESYEFWHKLEKHNFEENILNIAQPFNIVGNIKNINNSNEIVFGNFTVASVSQKRIFIDRPGTAFYFEDECALFLKYVVLVELGFPVITIISDYGEASVYEECVNCTLEGGETTKPDFWIDK